MAIEVESANMQDAVAPETQVPSTPVTAHANIHTTIEPDVGNGSPSVKVNKSAFTSPPPQSSAAEMTPPPSTQMPSTRYGAARLVTRDQDLFPSSPPPTVKLPNSHGLPTVEELDSATETGVRIMARDLLAAVSEARMSAAHFKLQHSLLAIESDESAQRAEIEHQMTRREVEVLQAAHARQKSSLAASQRSFQSASPEQVDILTKQIRRLQTDKASLQEKLDRLNELLEEEQDRVESLLEENARLKKRIRDNRDHFNRMRMQSPIQFSPSPRTEFMTPQRRTPHQGGRFLSNAGAQSHVGNLGSSDAFAALLAADQVLSGEAASVPSTPTRSQPSKLRQHGHVRGVQSLSSLPTTPSRVSRPDTSDTMPFTPQHQRAAPIDPRLAYSAPAPQMVVKESIERDRRDRDRDRRDRDSTISVSGSEAEGEDEAVTDEDIPPSQASSLATSMLRRNPAGAGSQEERGASAPSSQSQSQSQSLAEKSSNLLQTKLFGQVKKAGTGVDRSGPGGGKKRRAGSNGVGGGEDEIATKKARIQSQNQNQSRSEGVGLGIGHWGSGR